MIKDFNLLLFAVITVIELIIGYFVFMFYPITSMLFFGEGGGSFLYSHINGILWSFSPLTIVIFNIIELSIIKKDNTKMVNTYKVSTLVYLAFYIIFTSYWGMTNGYQI